MDGMLSQDEIDALLNGGSSSSSSSGSAGGGDSLSDLEKDAVGEVSNISLGTAATTLSSLLNQSVNITTPIVQIAQWDDLFKVYERPCVFIQIFYTEGLDGNNILIMKEDDVKIICNLMMGGDGTNLDPELSELHLSAICEAMNQMMGSASTSLSSMLDKKIDISPPTASKIDLAEQMDGGDIADFLAGTFVKVSFRMQIGDLIDSELMQLYSFDFAHDLCKQFMDYTGVGGLNVDTEESANAVVDEPEPEIPMPNQAGMGMGMAPQGMPMGGPQMGQMGYDPSQMGMYNPYMMQPGMMQPGMMPQGQPYMAPPMQDVNIAPVSFQQFEVNSPLMQTENIDLLLDVPLEVTAELGRTSKSIKEILDFSPGTIIELNRLAGEPIDVLVNGKHVAKGEVVVIEEAFGIRVTEVIK